MKINIKKTSAILITCLLFGTHGIYAEDINSIERFKNVDTTSIETSIPLAWNEDSVVPEDIKDFINSNFVFYISNGDSIENFKEIVCEKARQEAYEAALEEQRIAEIEEIFELFEEKRARAHELKMANVLKVYEENALFSYDPFFKSELTIEQFNKILKGTGLEGCGESYYNMEKEYGVNGIFAIAVAMHESGWGKYRANTNNFYGMRTSSGWMKFESKDENIQYFGKLMQHNWYYKKSIENIAKTYCPPTHQSWAAGIKNMMNTCWDRLIA